MLFSLIVPVYNNEKYIRQCIESIVSQSFEDYELILVDDGSLDKSAEICDEYSDKYETVKVIHKSNGGSNSARKAGVKIAQGDYIVCVDGDDYVQDDYFAVLHNVLSDKKYDICCFNSRTVSEYGEYIKDNTIDYRCGYYNKEDIQKEIFPTLITGIDGKRFSPAIWNKAIKREILAPIQQDLSDDIQIGEDSCLTYTSICLSNSLMIMGEKLYNYRANQNSMTRQRQKALSWQEPVARANFYLKYLPQDVFGMQIARITAHSLFNVAASSFVDKKYCEAKKDILFHLRQEENRKYVKIAQFKRNLKEKISIFCLRHKLIFPIFIYAKYM